MTEELLKEYKQKLSSLSKEELIERNQYLKDLRSGKIQGPLTGFASIDKPWCNYYSKEQLSEDMPKKTAYDYMFVNNVYHSKEIAINYFGNKITYDKLFKKIEMASRALYSLGVRKGDIVSICSVTTPEVIYLFYALNNIGAIANMVDPRTNDERLIEIFNKTNTKLLFSLNLVNPKIERLKNDTGIENIYTISAYDSLPYPVNIIKNKGKDIPKMDKKVYKSFKEFMNEASKIDKYEPMKYIPDYPAAIVYTGGTTGIAKGAILSNDNFNSMAFNYATANLGLKRQQKLLDIMPPFIAYGLNNGIHLPLSIGITNIIIPKFDVNEFPDLLIKHKPNIVLGVPSHFDILTKSKKLEKEDLSFLVYPACGGDSMNESLEIKLNKFLEEHNCSARITKGFGMTELSGAAITSSTTANKLKSAGIPFPRNLVGIFKEGTDEELKVGEIGEICITSPTMFHSYLDNIEEERKVKKVHSDGKIWVHSQDYGYVDKDGFLYVKGRIKRTIVRPDGHNNYPLEIENVINSCPGVRNSAVVDMEAKKYSNGHIPVAFIVLEEGIDEDYFINEITNYCNTHLPNRDVACKYIFLNEIPVTKIGKVDYIKLLEVLKDIINNDKRVEEEIYTNYEKTLIMK